MTAAEVVSEAGHRTSFDTTAITKTIPITGIQYLRPFLGETFFEEIDGQLPDSLSEDNSALLTNYLKPALAHFVMYEAFWKLNFQATTAGERNLLDDYSDPVRGKDLEIKRQDYMNKAQQWLNAAQIFIHNEQEETPSKFPYYSKSRSDKAQRAFNQEYTPE